MRRYLNWFWQKGILSTFLAGLFALLPIVITLGIMVWAAGLLRTGKSYRPSTIPTGTSFGHRSDRGVRSKLGRRPAGNLAFGRAAQIGREETD